MHAKTQFSCSAVRVSQNKVNPR